MAHYWFELIILQAYSSEPKWGGVSHHCQFRGFNWKIQIKVQLHGSLLSGQQNSDILFHTLLYTWSSCELSGDDWVRLEVLEFHPGSCGPDTGSGCWQDFQMLLSWWCGFCCRINQHLAGWVSYQMWRILSSPDGCS